MQSENLAMKPCPVVEQYTHLSTQYSNPVNDEEIVGFKDDTEKIIQLLIRGTNELDVIPIVGMGGQGKTTCARKLYSNDTIVSKFDVRAWCIISQTYSRRELLKEIISQVSSSKDKGDKDDADLSDMLRKSLIGRRYLIVLDDMWDVMAWDDLKLSFPDDGNRSRIIVTTRLDEVGEHVKHKSDLYFLPFLTSEESCQLLRKKVFQQEGYPPELYDVSLKVAESCKGLPLMVVLAAGIIKKKKMEISWWNEVNNALFSYLGCDSEDYIRGTMKLSYDNLPNYLRPCLLYMGMFPEDAKIPVSKLTSLWIAEGFVQNIELGKLEEAAESYLMDLISSNLVMVSKRRYNGKVKYFQVHDVVRHFCLEKSREEKFMLAVKGHHNQFRPSDWEETRLSFNITNEHSMIALPGSKIQKPFHQPLRSLITYGGSDYLDWNPFHQISNLRLLKVLDLGNVRSTSEATLQPLIHLKYLALKAENFDFHPESYPHLETLMLTSGRDVILPAKFWKMEKLRHVEIWGRLGMNKQWMFEKSLTMGNLRILRTFECGIDEVNVLARRCPNLQELKISINNIENVMKLNCYEYSEEVCINLESLTQLQTLHLSAPKILASDIHLPSNLKKLALYGPSVVNTASSVAGLLRLEYLQLWNHQLEEWCLGDIKFHKLKILKLVRLKISRWEASEESFPLLETLVINWCAKLKEIPLSFADIQTLKQIKLIGRWEKSLEASAVKIKKEVQEIEGSDRIHLIMERRD